MKRIPSLLLGASAALLIAAPVAAQQLDSPYRFLEHNQAIGIYGGYLNAAEGRVGAGAHAAPMFGVNWGIRVSGAFAVGADVGISPTKRTVRDTAFVVEDSAFAALGEVDMTLLIAMANLRFDVTGARTWHGLQPFLLVGLGVSHDMSGTSELDLEQFQEARFSHGTSFAGQLGAGLEWFPSSRVSLNAAARNILWKLEVPEAFLLTERGRTMPRSDWEQNFVVAAGLSFHF